MSVVKLIPAVTHRCCPKCGYLMPQRQIELIRFELTCPTCGEHTTREFQPIKMKGEQ